MSRWVKGNVFTIMMAWVATLAWFAGGASAAEHTKDSLDTVRQNLDKKAAILVDVREKSEWNRGHIEGAIHVPLSELKKKGEEKDFLAELQKKLSKGKNGEKLPIYCHCAAGRRALEAGDLLKKLGYEAKPLSPGFKDLIEYKVGDVNPFPKAKDDGEKKSDAK